jgi:hypothetical protein
VKRFDAQISDFKTGLRLECRLGAAELIQRCMSHFSLHDAFAFAGAKTDGWKAELSGMTLATSSAAKAPHVEARGSDPVPRISAGLGTSVYSVS